MIYYKQLFFFMVSLNIIGCDASTELKDKAVHQGQVVIANKFNADISIGISMQGSNLVRSIKIPTNKVLMLPCGSSCIVTILTQTSEGSAVVKRTITDQKRYLLIINNDHLLDIAQLSEE